METISVFGGSGFIGSHFINKFKFEVVPIKRSDVLPLTKEILWFVSTVDNYNVFTDPLLDIYTNEQLLMEMLQAGKNRYGSDFTVNFVSSWFVYGKTSDVVSEDSPCKPEGFYSITKYAAEQLLISYCKTFGIKYRIFRLANIIGVGDKKVSKKKNAIQYMVEELVMGNTIQLYKDHSHRNVLDVRDCVEIIYSLIRNSPTNEIYNVGRDISIDVNELIEDAHKMCGTGNIELVEVPEFHKQVQVKDFDMSIDKIIPYLPFSTFRTYENTLNWIISEKKKLHENS